MKHLICAVVVATMVSGINANANLWKTLLRGPDHWNLPNVREAIKGPEGKQYYMGTTTDIIAVYEVMRSGSEFWNSRFFWQGFLANMQVDVTNYSS